jgi:hypothetical protein
MLPNVLAATQAIVSSLRKRATKRSSTSSGIAKLFFRHKKFKDKSCLEMPDSKVIAQFAL